MAEEPINGGTVVKYTVKELLQEIRDSVRALDVKLDAKADRTEVSGHEARIAAVEIDVRLLKEQHSHSTDLRRWLVPLVVSIAIAAPGWLQAVGLH